MFAILAGGCPKAGGDYAQTDRMGGADRGETNGRMFDLIANMPDGDDWQVRIRDDSMWVSYSSGDEVEDLGTRGLSTKEARRVWDLIDNVDIGSRKRIGQSMRVSARRTPPGRGQNRTGWAEGVEGV